MIHNPRIITDAQRRAWRITEHRKETRGNALRFWGGLAIAAAAALFIIQPRLHGVGDAWGFAFVVALAATGAVMIAAGGRPATLEIQLAEIRPDDGQIEIFPEASTEFDDLRRTIWFEEIAHVVFGMTRFPLHKGKGAPRVEAFTVCLHLFDGSVVPVVEATTDKNNGFLVARQLSESIGVPIQEAGLGA